MWYPDSVVHSYVLRYMQRAPVRAAGAAPGEGKQSVMGRGRKHRFSILVTVFKIEFSVK